jgi:peptidoglycan/LPS O-acetylase OafA/YrhL
MAAERDIRIDALRGVAALGVLALHTQNAWYLGVGSDVDPERRLRLMDHWLGIASIPVTFGWLGVNLFFVLSGLCIHYWLLNARASGQEFSYAEYLRRRFWRLYPAYVAGVVLSIGLLAGAEWIRFNLQNASEPSLFGRNVIEQTFRYLTFTHTLTRDTIAGYNPPLYTLATEVHFYLLYPLVLKAFLHWGAWRTLAGSVALSAVLLAGAYATGDLNIIRPVEESALARWPEWIVGCVIAEVWFKNTAAPRWTLRRAVPVSAAFLSVGLYLLLSFRLVINPIWTFGIAALLLPYLARPECQIGPTERRLAVIGLFSYSL